MIVVHVKPFLIYGKTPEEDNALEDYFKITLQLIKYILYKYKMNGGDIMIGQKIKGLLILDLDEEKNNKLKLERKQGLRSNAPVYYICQCDCGNIISLTKPKILKRQIYGCVKCNKKDFSKYINQKINSWTILEYIKEERKFRCKCECGTIKDVNCYNLINNQSKDCGCGRSEKMSDIRSIDCLVGQTFGRLTVIEEIGKNKWGKTICKCKCECGNEIEVLSNSLRTNHTISCGCVKSQTPYEIKKYLNELGYEAQMEKRIDLEEHENISCMYFDLYVEKLNLAIEYDGKPHFTPIDWAGKGINWAIENLKLAEYRDNIKDKACYDRGIFLLRIPYTRKDNFKEMINEVIDIILF